jgi:hypothetical protein
MPARPTSENELSSCVNTICLISLVGPEIRGHRYAGDGVAVTVPLTGGPSDPKVVWSVLSRWRKMRSGDRPLTVRLDELEEGTT